MRVLSLSIDGFRGIRKARLALPKHGVLVGANGVGKSTVIDALSLVFGRNQLVRELTEHDFFGSCPEPGTRIRIVVSLGGFSSNNSEDFPTWFRHGRGVPKWWRPTEQDVVAEPGASDHELCVEIGFSARFDLEDLAVEQLRYFHDDEVTDPFLEDSVARFPHELLKEIGFFLLPTRRTWASTISFASELFRRAVSTVGSLPSDAIQNQLRDIRSPSCPIEQEPGLRDLVQRIDARMSQFLPGRPRLQLRLTSTDSDSVLKTLVPHYEGVDGFSLPAVRHGTGLVSLQTLALLLEIGRERKQAGLSFILALEEPELHVPPGLQRRLLGEAVGMADQTVCTTHSPRVAALFHAQEILILGRSGEVTDNGSMGEEEEDQACESNRRLEARTLAPASMMNDPNPLGKLYTEHRTRLVEALMFPCVLVPEGRTDYDWLRLLLDATETASRPLGTRSTNVPLYGATIGAVPTQSSQVVLTFERLRTLHERVAILVDGDNAGDSYIERVLRCNPPPLCCIQWPPDWAIENAVVWALEAGGDDMLREINLRLARDFGSFQDLTTALISEDGRTGGLKQFSVAHEEIAGAMKRNVNCVERIDLLLEAMTRAVTGDLASFAHLALDQSRSIDDCPVVRFQP